MSGIISLKGNKYGLSVCISESATFDQIKYETAEYFKHAQKMFGNEKIAIGFEGKKLSSEERNELVEIIGNNCSLDIICVMDFNSETEETFKKAIERTEAQILYEEQSATEEMQTTEYEESTEYQEEEAQEFDMSSIARFYKGNLRSGMVINEESSLVIIGDINPGAEVYSAGNIIILGSLKGIAFAGTKGNQNAFVFALNMEPIQIQIADTIGRAGDSTDRRISDEHEPKIARIKDNSIAIELVSKTVLNDIII